MGTLSRMAPTRAVSTQSTSETMLERLRGPDLDRDRIVPDMESTAQTKVARQRFRAANNRQGDFLQMRVKQQFIVGPSRHVDTLVEREGEGKEKREGKQGRKRGRAGERCEQEKEQVENGTGRYDILTQIENHYKTAISAPQYAASRGRWESSL